MRKVFAAVALVAAAAVEARSFTHVTTDLGTEYMKASKTTPYVALCGTSNNYLVNTDAMVVTGKYKPQSTSCGTNHICYHEFGGSFLYTSTCDGVVAQDMNGTVAWKSAAVPGINGAWGPAYKDGKVYVSMLNGAIVALNAATGALLWQTTSATGAASRPLVMADYLAFIGKDGALRAMSLSTKAVTKIAVYPLQSQSEFNAVPLTSFSFDDTIFTNNGKTITRVNLAKGSVDWTAQITAPYFSGHHNAAMLAESAFDVFAVSGHSVVRINKASGSISSTAPNVNITRPTAIVAFQQTVATTGTEDVALFSDMTGANTGAFSVPIPVQSLMYNAFASSDKKSLIMKAGNWVIKTPIA